MERMVAVPINPTPRGEIVFQKRSATKDTYPNLLDASAGGHIEVGQTPEQAAIMELEEETGIKVSGDKLKFISKDRSKSKDPVTGMTNNVIRYIYAYGIDTLDNLAVEKGKADGFEAYTLEQLENLTDESKTKFISKMLSPENMELYKKILAT